ncbi:MAG: hypothetical protein Q9173_006692 [Seirophora scorigena]
MSDNEDCPDPALAASTYYQVDGFFICADALHRHLPSPTPPASEISSADALGYVVGEKALKQMEQHSHLLRSAPSAGWDSDVDCSHVDTSPSQARSAETTRPRYRSISPRPPNRPAAAFTYDGTLPRLADLNLPTPFQSISDSSLDEMADVAIDATCQTAIQSEDGAGRMWMLWKSYLQPGTASSDQAPPPGVGPHERRQAVEYLCQDVYCGLLGLLGEDVTKDRLWIYRTLVEVTTQVGNDEAVEKIGKLFRHEINEATDLPPRLFSTTVSSEPHSPVDKVQRGMASKPMGSIHILPMRLQPGR